MVDARDQREARRKFLELDAAAAEAVCAGEVAEFLDELDRRIRPPATSTFQSFVEEEWIPTVLEAGDLRESQVESDRSVLRCHLLPYFGPQSLSDIDARLLDRYKASKRKQEHQYGAGYSAKSINNHLSLLRRILAKAEEYGHITRNPVGPKVWMRRERTPEDFGNWWRPDEEERASAVLDCWRDRHPDRRRIILTQLITGLRFSEIRALRNDDLDMDVPGLWVRRSMARSEIGTPKNKRARLQVIPRALAEELREWMLRADGDLLFPGPSGGPLANNTLNRWYRRLCGEAGVRDISSHGARHTSGSSYAVMGAGQKVIAQLLGHTDTHATERYTHVQVEATRPLVEGRWARLHGRGGVDEGG